MHSKEIAEAAANAVETNTNAILFNPADANFDNLGLDTSNYDGTMISYVVDGEILSNLGLGPESIGYTEMLPNQNETPWWVIGSERDSENLNNAIKNHLMSSVESALDEVGCN